MRTWLDIVRELRSAAYEYNRQKAGTLTGELCDWLRSDQPTLNPLEENDWMEPLTILKGRRYFELIVNLAEALHQTNHCTLKSRRIYAQALIELGLLTTAIDVLDKLSTDCISVDNSVEYSEVRGLKGRTHKQIFVELSRSGEMPPVALNHLNLAVLEYYEIYKRSPIKNYWHGINVVALLNRAKSTNIPLSIGVDGPTRIAREILSSLFPDTTPASNPAPNPWECATAAEACIALGDYDKALEFTLIYTSEKLRTKFNIEAFEYASTLRQLEEIWQFTPEHEGQSRILHLLRSVLLGQEGGQITIDSLGEELKSLDELSFDKNFEAVLGKERYHSFKWYQNGLQRAASVVKISNNNNEGIGTGFVIKSSYISDKILNKWVLFTNAHVISKEETERNPKNSGTKALHPSDVVITFEAGDDTTEYILEDIIYSSGRDDLDCTIATFVGDPSFEEELPIPTYTPIFDSESRLYVIGHPRGGGLSFSLHDNKFLAARDHLIHYRAPTEGGSSGSPVFSADWQLIAIHHAGGTNMKMLDTPSETYQANEGILIFSIIRDINL